MPRYHTAIASVSLLALAPLLALTLAGCHKSSQDMSATTPNNGLPPLPAALPMQTGPASQLTTAPPVSAIPVRRYVGISRPANERDAYAYLDRAGDIEDAVGDAPPDYEYDNDDGVSPWVWETSGGDYRYAEPARDGYRYYYYQPGAEYPYLVRTHDRSYAYAGGALVAIYALSGALLPPDRYGGYRDQASRYFSRGQQLRHAAQQRPHQGVVAADWAAQRPHFNAAQANWAAARTQQPAWQAYHAQNDPSRQPGWQQEHQQRAAVAQQFSGWQSHGLTGAPPPVLAAVGARAAVTPAAPPVAAPSHQRPAMAGPEGAGPQGAAGTQRFAGPQGFPGQDQPHRHDIAGPQGFAPLAGPVPGPAANPGGQAAAAHEQQLAGQRQALASQRLAQEASRAQQDAAAQRQAAAARQQAAAAQQQARASQRAEQEASRAREQAAMQQQIANVHRQQDMAAQEQVAAHQQAQQHDAVAAARVAQVQAAAAQRQAAQRQDVARVHAPRPEAGPPPGHAEPWRPGQVHAPGHEKDHNQQ